MSIVSSAKKRKIGRPRVDSAAVNVRFLSDALEAIDAARREHPEIPTRPELVRIAVQDWLRAKGYLK